MFKKVFILLLTIFIITTNINLVFSEDEEIPSDNDNTETTEVIEEENIEEVFLEEENNQEEEIYLLNSPVNLLSDPMTRDVDNTGVFQMYWLSGSDEITINPERTELIQNPQTNTSPSDSFSSTTNYVQAKIDFSTGGDKTVEEGQAEIRLPYHLYYDRNNNPVDKIYLSLLEDPKLPSEDISFNYYIDNKGTDDPGDDEIVIKNCYKITSARLFTMTLSWAYTPSKVLGGYEDDNGDWQNVYQKSFNARAKMSYIDHHETEVLVEKETANLSLEVHTKSRFYSNSKEAMRSYNSWQETWGNDPHGDLPEEEKDKYFYVLWRGFFKVPTGNTQPFVINLIDIPEDGEVVAYARGRSAITSNYQPSDYRFYDGNVVPLENYDSDSTYILMKGSINSSGNLVYDEPNDNEHTRSAGYFIITRHERKYDNNGFEVGQTVNNTMKFVLEGQDGCIDEQIRQASFYYPGDYYEYPGDQYSITKFWQTSYYYPVENLLYDKDCPSSTLIYISGTGTSYDLTKDENNQYGVNDYTLSLIDDFISIWDPSNSNKYVLNKDDYYFSRLNITGVTHYYLHPKEHDERVVTDYTNPLEYRPLDVYVKRASMGDDWIYYGSYPRSSTNLNISIPFESQGINDVYGVRVDDTTNRYKTTISMNMGFVLKSTEHTKQIAEEVGYGKTLNVYNYDSLAIRDSEGNYHDTTDQDAVTKWGNNPDGNSLLVHDNEYDNTKLLHARAYNNLKSFPFESFTEKVVKATTPSDRIIKVDGANPTVTFRMYTDNSVRVGYDVSGDDFEFMNEILNEYSDVIFYDLLPVGGYYIEDSVFVYDAINFRRSNAIWGPLAMTGEEISKDYYTVSSINNYKNSGRTLLKVEIHLPDGYHNFKQNGDTYGSGIMVDYTMGYTDYALHNIGPTVNNTFYLENLNGELRNGQNGNGGNTADKERYKTLDEEDNIDQTKKYRYSNTASAVFRLEQAAELGYHKYVRAVDNEDPNWRVVTNVGASKEYEYLLMMNNLESSYANDVIIYEVLETAFKDQGLTIVNHDHWNGKFVSVDTSDAKQYNDIDIKTYYSTVTSVELNSNNEKEATFIPIENSSQQLFINGELNTTYWNEYPQEGLPTSEAEQVTALAFDLREKNDGTSKVFDAGEKVQIKIKMKAPVDVKNYKDHLDEEPRDLTTVDAEGEKIAAWNQSTITATIWNVALGMDPSAIPDADKFTAIENSNRVEVYTYDFIEIEKHSDVPTGTNTHPALLPEDIANGKQELKYYITLRNKVEAGEPNLKNVTVIDEIPVGLIVQEEELEYSLHENNEENYKPINGSDEITWIKKTGNIYEFVLNEFASGQELKIMIPVKTADDSALRYDNISKVTSFNNSEYIIESNKTHHQRIPYEVTASKKLDGENTNKTFTFQLLDNEGNMLQEKTNDNNGLVKFDKIYFDEFGTHNFTVKEIYETDDYTYVYDEREYKIRVDVSENPNTGYIHLEDKITVNNIEVNEIVFENKTPDSASLILKAQKKVDGMVPKDTFTFELYDEEENLIEQVTNDNKGDITFNEILLNEIGTYTYYIKELIPEDTRYIYDNKVYEIKVEVIFGEDGYEIESITYISNEEEKEVIIFENKIPTGALVKLEAKKTINGSKPNDVFEFELRDEENNLIEKVKNNSDGKVLFNNMEFKEEGEYIYYINEIKGNKDYKYDSRKYKVIINVTYVLDHYEAKITYELDDKEVKEVLFDNLKENKRIVPNTKAK